MTVLSDGHFLAALAIVICVGTWSYYTLFRDGV